MNRQMMFSDPNAQPLPAPLGAAPVQMHPMVQALLAQSGHPMPQGSVGGGLAGGMNPAMLAMALRGGEKPPGQSYYGTTGPFGNNTPGGLRVGGQDGYFTSQLPGQ